MLGLTEIDDIDVEQILTQFTVVGLSGTSEQCDFAEQTCSPVHSITLTVFNNIVPWCALALLAEMYFDSTS